MASLSVKLPLQRDDADGFTMIKSFRTLIKQNLKMLLLTVKGERVMEPDFGVGLKTYLFSNLGEDAPEQINNDIRRQVAVFMPIVNLMDIDFDTGGFENNTLGITITYSIPDLGIEDLLEFTI